MTSTSSPTIHSSKCSKSNQNPFSAPKSAKEAWNSLFDGLYYVSVIAITIGSVAGLNTTNIVMQYCGPDRIMK